MEKTLSEKLKEKGIEVGTVVKVVWNECNEIATVTEIRDQHGYYKAGDHRLGEPGSVVRVDKIKVIIKLPKIELQ